MAKGKINLFHPEQVLFQYCRPVIYTLRVVIVVNVVINLGLRRQDRLPKPEVLIK
jgi:hypothetical protein